MQSVFLISLHFYLDFEDGYEGKLWTYLFKIGKQYQFEKNKNIL